MERIDSFISHFQTFLSILEDDTERPERARMVQNSHSLPPKTGQRSPPNMPAGGPLLRHTPDFSGNTPSPSSAYHLPPSVPPRGFAEANFRPPVPPSALSNPNPSLTVGVRFSPSGSPLPPQYPYPNPSHTSPSPSPSFGTFPPFMMTPPLALHTLLSNHTTSKFGPLSLDFTDTNFNYRVFHAPATNPPVTAITLVFNEDDFVKPTNAIDLTAIQASSLPAVRVADVLDVIYRTLNRPITRIEWDQLAEKEKLHVTQAFNSRCSGSYRERVRAEGVKKVDYARRTRFRALVEVERRIYKVMLE
ncbi:hypothetical protein L218DRAFT_657743 [Marasmius fiardii PR-910]|nr:hypothetical protein L218DRAFT_657743 [Marasmius fiardii PR-910]